MTYLIQRNDFYVRVTNPSYKYTTKHRINILLDQIHARTGIHPDFILRKTRIREHVQWRQIVCFIAATNNYGSLQAIAEAVGYKGHDNVIHSREVVKDSIYIKDRMITDKLDLIKDLINSDYDTRR